MCLAQGHNAVTPVRLEPVAPQSRVKHSTTEPLRSPMQLLMSFFGDLDPDFNFQGRYLKFGWFLHPFSFTKHKFI